MTTTLHPRIDEVLVVLRGAQQELDDLLATVPATLADRVPPGGGWTVAQVVEHLAIVEDGTGRLISKLIRQADGTTEVDTTPVAASLDRYRVWDASGRPVEAPPLVQPTRAVGLADARGAQATARDRLMAAFVAASGRALGSVTHPHPVVGPLDVYQWGLFVAHHQRRHCTQIRDILSATA